MIFEERSIQMLEEHLGTKKTYSLEELQYLKKVQHFTPYVSWIPGLRMLAIGNSLAMKAADDKSDIDLFIVLQKNRLWLGRILITFIFSILGERKTSKKHAGKFCLSFFCNEEALDFSSFALEKDIYLFYWILTLKPLLDYNETYKNFREQNTWANFTDFGEYFENSNEFLQEVGTRRTSDSQVLDVCDQLCKTLFLPKTMTHYENQGKPYGIIINNNMLKFHNNDRRIFLRDIIFKQSTGKKPKAV